MQIRVIKTKAGKVLIQHAPDGMYHDDNLPLPKTEVAAEALSTHQELEAAGVRDVAQLDIVGGKVVIDVTKPAFHDLVEARRQAAIDKLAQLPGDAAVDDAVKGYLLAIIDVLAVGPGEMTDPNQLEP